MPDQQEGQGGAQDGKYDGERGKACDVHFPPPSGPGATFVEPGFSSAAACSAGISRPPAMTVATGNSDVSAGISASSSASKLGVTATRRSSTSSWISSWRARTQVR